MKKGILAANWKMNLAFDDAIKLFDAIKDADISKQVEIMLMPQFPMLKSLIDLNTQTNIKIGAQYCSQYLSGAYTGDVSSTLLKEIGCACCIVGHSERRTLFYETDETCLKRVKLLIQQHIQPILCVGETKEIREENKHKTFVTNQVHAVLNQLDSSEQKKIIIAYEPIWAIGTGLSASQEQADEMHQTIRNEVIQIGGQKLGDTISILYGGSVKPENATQLFQMQNIDGFLIGGASLNDADFLSIIYKVISCLDSF